jgi:protein required for attachment to host cells
MVRARRKAGHDDFPTLWVVVAESSRARIFETTDGVSLSEIADVVHPEGRLRERQLTSDRQGRTYDSSGRGRHSKQDPVSAHEQENIAFARAIARCLKAARQRNAFETVILIAPPHFLGLLRKSVDPVTLRRIRREVPKDIGRASATAVLRYL